MTAPSDSLHDELRWRRSRHRPESTQRDEPAVHECEAFPGNHSTMALKPCHQRATPRPIKVPHPQPNEVGGKREYQGTGARKQEEPAWYGGPCLSNSIPKGNCGQDGNGATGDRPADRLLARMTRRPRLLRL
jgi:hypothetical protein